MASLSCLPDAYLSEAHLKTFFNDFHGMISAGLPEATVFSSLVNNVRNVYMASILGANEELLSQFRENARQQAALQREREDERGSPPPQYGASNPMRPAPPVPSAVEAPGPIGWAPDAPGRLEGRGIEQIPSPGQGQVRQEEICWPANTFTLHVGSYSADIRRDLPDWEQMNKAGWTERLDFKVFKYKEPGTIQISVVEGSSPHRMMANLNNPSTEGWKKRLEFYAYSQERPGTQMIWAAYRGDPDRCLFLKGGPADTLDGWERRFDFWVPK